MNIYVFNLVKSLSQGEKKYFRRYAHINGLGEGEGHTNFTRLFDVLDGMKEYNETTVRKKLAGNFFLNHLASTGNYLSRFLLKSMRAYYADASAAQGVKGMISDIMFLYRKGCYAHCLEAIEKAKQLAQKNDLFLQEAEILSWELAVKNTSGAAMEYSPEYYKEVLNQQLKCLEAYGNYCRALRLINEISRLVAREGEQRSSGVIEKCKSAFEESGLWEDDSATHFRSKTLLYMSKINYADIAGYTAMHSAYAEKTVQLYESEEGRIYENPIPYLWSLFGLGSCQEGERKYDAVLNTAEKIKHFSLTLSKDNLSFIQVRSNAYSYNILLRMMAYNHSGQPEKAFPLIREWEKAIAEGTVLPGNRIGKASIVYNGFLSCFLLGEFSSALKFLDTLREGSLEDYAPYFYSNLRIMYLITQTEIGNADILDALARSVYRWLMKRERLYGVEKEILSFLRKDLPNKLPGQDLRGLFIPLKERMKKYLEDPFEKPGLEYFDYISWLDSKITGRPFAEIIREKAKKSMD